MTFTDNQRSGTKKMLAKLKPKMIMFSLPAAASNSDCRRSHPDCRAIAWDLERIAADHNDRVFEHEITDRTRRVLDWTVALEPGRHSRMVARFFWHQPRFLYDMARYKLRTWT